MKITCINIILTSLLMTSVSSAMVGRTVSLQDKIMNQEVKPIKFNDVVRSIDELEDGTFKITFQKHAAIYKMNAQKGKAMLDILKKSQNTKMPVNISILPGENQVLQIIE